MNISKLTILIIVLIQIFSNSLIVPIYSKPNVLVINQENTNWNDDIPWNLDLINTSDAWTITTGDPNIIVAVIDTGIDYNHPDLKDSIWKNMNEVPENNLDDDANGYIDDIQGWDFGDDDNDPYDNHGHGTHVAGIIAAKLNNYGLVGLAPNVKIMPLRVFGSSSLNTFSDKVSEAILYAVDNNAKVISMSIGFVPTNDKVENAIDYAISKNVLLVAAAGNENSDIIWYPAADSDVITVGAVDSNKNRAEFSNYGSSIDIVAPGVSINSTTNPKVTSEVDLVINDINIFAFDIIYGNTTTGLSGQLIDVVNGNNLVNYELTDKIALLRRQSDDRTNQELVANLSRHGAIGVIIYDILTTFHIPISFNSTSPIPTILVPTTIGEQILEALSTQDLFASVIIKGTEYNIKSGTSMSTPHVSAAAALIASVNSSLDYNEVKSILQRSATDLGELGKDGLFGYGLLNVYLALQLALDNNNPEIEIVEATSNPIDQGYEVELSVKVLDDVAVYGFVYWHTLEGITSDGTTLFNLEKTNILSTTIKIIVKDIYGENQIFFTIEDLRGNRASFGFKIENLLFPYKITTVRSLFFLIEPLIIIILFSVIFSRTKLNKY